MVICQKVIRALGSAKGETAGDSADVSCPEITAAVTVHLGAAWPSTTEQWSHSTSVYFVQTHTWVSITAPSWQQKTGVLLRTCWQTTHLWFDGDKRAAGGCFGLPTSATQHAPLVQLHVWTWISKRAHSQTITRSNSHAKHSADTLRPTTCAAFSSRRTPDVVTDGQGSEQVREELSRNSAGPEPSPQSPGEVQRLHLFSIRAGWVEYMKWGNHTYQWPSLFHVTQTHFVWEQCRLPTSS